MFEGDGLVSRGSTLRLAARRRTLASSHTAVVFGRDGNVPVLSIWQFTLAEQLDGGTGRATVVEPVFGA